MTSVPLDVRIALLKQYGSASQSYSATFQPNLEHFGDERGFVGYKTIFGTAMVLSDPIASQDNFNGLIVRFLKAHPDSSFSNVSRRVAEILAALGFFINEMGPDTWIDLASYDFAGAKKTNLRRATSRTIRSGFVMREASLAEVGLDEVTNVSDGWRRTRRNRNREIAFLNRPLVLVEEMDVRRFFCFDRHGKPVAFQFFDPIYKGGEVIGYMSQHNRHLPHADPMVHFAIKSFAIETFQREGRKWLSLGMSPFAHIHDKDFPQHKNWLVRRGFRFAYTNGLFNRYFYPLQGLETHKRQFRGIPEQTYFAFNKLPSLPRLLKLLVACRII